MNLLVISGGRHPYEESTPVLERFLKDAGHEATVTEDASVLADAAGTSGYDALVFNTLRAGDNHMTKAEQTGMTNFIKNGKGFVCLHISGCASDDNIEYKEGNDVLAGPLPFLDRLKLYVELAVDRQHQRHGVLGDGDGVCSTTIRHLDSYIVEGRQVHPVGLCAGDLDELELGASGCHLDRCVADDDDGILELRHLLLQGAAGVDPREGNPVRGELLVTVELFLVCHQHRDVAAHSVLRMGVMVMQAAGAQSLHTRQTLLDTVRIIRMRHEGRKGVLRTLTGRPSVPGKEEPDEDAAIRGFLVAAAYRGRNGGFYTFHRWMDSSTYTEWCRWWSRHQMCQGTRRCQS